MPRKRTTMGSIYADRGRLYVKFKGQRFAVGVRDTKVGRKRAEKLLDKLWESYHKVGELVDKSNIKVKDAFEKFLLTKITNYDKTIKMYKSSYKAIITDNYYLTEDNIERDIQDFVRHSTYSQVTKNTYLRHLRVFLKYCERKTWIPLVDVGSYMKTVTSPAKEPFEDEEIEALLEYFRLKHPKTGKIIEFMVETGARMVDALTLEWDQVKGDTVVWRNKITKRPEPRPISKRAKEILELFAHADKKVFGYSYASAPRLNYRLRRACCDCLIDRRGRSFQNLRVTFRMRLLKAGVPKEYVMYLLRHRYENVTDNYYTHFEDSSIRNMLDRISEGAD